MFDTLLQLPLFQGLCHEDFTSILEKTKLHFIRRKPGERFVTQGDKCEQLTFIIKGTATMQTESADKTFTMIEKLEAPYLIEPQILFGLNQTYYSSYCAVTEVNIINIAKSAILAELMNYEIFRLNYMNVISSRAQSMQNRIWHGHYEHIEDRILNFIYMHVDRPAGEKTLKIKMEDLALYLDETRLNVSKALNNMQKVGILTLKRGEIFIDNLPGAIELRRCVTTEE
jgi:CRP-like cAMP-binding protein